MIFQLLAPFSYIKWPRAEVDFFLIMDIEGRPYKSMFDSSL